ncbi:MAG TPA: alpha/beta-type small acid-soluble spore protein [Desulfitobacteriaceae bacterium]|nr:alpha/beta-type small acid-soluble spore protein [Desulfitobacteriaceae bacterium]
MSRNKLEVPESGQQMEKLKWEVAGELELDDDIKEKGYANMTTREVGKIGGNMVKKMVEYAEKEMETGTEIKD